MTRATATDGEFRVHVACRRPSSALPSLSSTGSYPMPEPSTNAKALALLEDGDVSKEVVTSEEVADRSGYGGSLVGFNSFAAFESDSGGARQAGGVNLPDFRFLFPVADDRGASMPRRHCCRRTSCGVVLIPPSVVESVTPRRRALLQVLAGSYGDASVPFDGRGGVVHGCGGVPSIIDVGEVLGSSVVPKVARIRARDKVSK
ncbi:hypothetical protein Dimus_036193 [Dionaea muscipula]